jgi:sacsin
MPLSSKVEIHLLVGQELYARHSNVMYGVCSLPAGYHITDVPSFVSGSHLVIFDPHCTHLPNISSANPGKKINFVEPAGRAAARACAGQLAPYQGAFGCDLTSGSGSGRPWQGTLFRFPLRTAALAAHSNISKQVR